MKKISFLGCIAAALLSFAGCEQTGNDYEGTNYIYLESQDGKATIYETDEEPLTVTVMLTKALDEDVDLMFALQGTEGVVELEGNPVTIKAGEKSASLGIVSLNKNVLEATATYTLALDASTVLPEGVALKGEFQFVVSPLSIDALTDAQKAVVEAYKTATGVDLSKYIGAVNVSTVITGTDPDTYEPLAPQTITGKTVITLSESADAETPVLKMIANPMGIQDYMYRILRSVTVEDSEYWCDGDSYPDNVNLMNTIGWNAESAEVFSMSLDNIQCNADKSVTFVGMALDQYEEEITIVPFDYEFTAYEREKTAISDGSFVKDEYSYDATANPSYHLNNSDIAEDGYEGGNWVEASAEISNESLVFTFCFYGCYLDGDYTRVVATYTPNN